MKTIRYFLLTLFVLAPGLALAQGTALGDSIAVEIVGVDTYPSYGSAFTPLPANGETFGPFPVVAAVTGNADSPFTACNDDGEITNADDITGNIALISRGGCRFDEKVVNAFGVGAIGVIIQNNAAAEPDTIITMGGVYMGESTDIPAVMISLNNGQLLRDELKFGSVEASFTGIDVAPVPTFEEVSTGTASLALVENGFIGDAPGILPNPSFEFMGDAGLFIGSFVIGQISGADTTVAGSPYANAPEFEALTAATEVSGPFDAPFADFDQAAEALFSSDLGVDVTARAYARDGDPFVVLEYVVNNTTGGNIEDLYMGIFADWDVGDATTNLGGFNEDQDVLFVYDSSAVSTNYFGVAALGMDASGWTLATDAGATDPSVYEALTTLGEELELSQDTRAVIGVGPFTIMAGESQIVQFAVVGGTSEADIIDNAQDAQNVLDVAVEATTPEGTFVLESAYPNPVASRATIGFDLPTAQDVTLKVYDVLGREVATLVDGVRQAGEQSVELDVASLPSGMYIYRLEAGATQLTQTLTVVR